MGPACNEQAMQHNVGMCSTASGCMSCQLYSIKLCLAFVTYETSNCVCNLVVNVLHNTTYVGHKLCSERVPIAAQL